MTVHGIIFSKFDPEQGPIISDIFPSDISKKFSSQQLAKIAIQSLALYETDRESFNIFIIRRELIGVAYVIKILGNEFERRMVMFSLILLISDLNPLVLKMVLKNTVTQVYSNFLKTGSFNALQNIMKNLYTRALRISKKADEKHTIILDKHLFQKIEANYSRLISNFSMDPVKTLQELEKEEPITRSLVYHLGYLAGIRMWLRKNKALLEIGAKMDFNYSAILKQALIPACNIFGKVKRGSSQSVSIYSNRLVKQNYPCAAIEGYLAGIIRKILDYSKNPNREFVLKEAVCSSEGFEYCDLFISLYEK